MSLPLPWVDEIFRKLTLVYGQQFLNRWRDLDLGAVKVDWADKLDGLQNAPKAIAYALEHIDPAKPPTVIEFRALAYKAPLSDVPRIEAPRASTERIAAELAKLAPVRKAAALGGGHDPKAWAKKIIARHDAGEKILPISLRFAREALQTPGERAGLAVSA